MSVEALAAIVDEAQYLVALTGAGVSTESGIPDFRSAGEGLWRGHDPMEVASIDGFYADPGGFYAFWADRFSALQEKRPNKTHEVLATLERRGALRAVITQNIDGLHSAAGSEKVLEVHGSYRRARCLGCGTIMPLSEVLAIVRGGGRPNHHCGGLIKPDVVLFGEQLPAAFASAERHAQNCDALLVLGSSLKVHPVAGLVPLARSRGAAVGIVNRDPGPYDDIAQVVVHAQLGETMQRMLSLIDER